ncbi:MAG: hypothetical protein IJB71_04540 [Bacilli bacterium]|nr:hypothetical protein [Bacilli bacterium]
MYLCDIKVNFNKQYYDFFDWNKNDKIVTLKQVPLFFTRNLENIIYHQVKFPKEFLTKIKNETKTRKNNLNYKYACMLTNKSKFLAIILNEEGIVKEISDISILDDIELNNDLIDQKIQVVDYEIINANKKVRFFTREEEKIKKFLNKKQNSKYDKSKLKYLYFEKFNKKEEDIDKIILELKKILTSNWDENYLKIYDFFKVIL